MLVHVEVVQEPALLADSINMVDVVRRVNFLVYDGPIEALRMRLAHAVGQDMNLHSQDAVW